MGRILDIFQRLRGTPATDLTLIKDLTDPFADTPKRIAGLAFEPDQHYVEVFVESLRLKRSRAFTTTFHGVVYAFFKLTRNGTKSLEIASMTKPGGLAELDPEHLDRVITVQKKILGATPWRGGTMGVELGLISAKQGDLMTPFLNYIVKFSDVASSNFLGQAKPFLPLITDGLQILSTQTNDTEIEIAVDTDIPLAKSLLCAQIAVPKNKIDLSEISIDPADMKLLHKGQPLQEAYCVFSIRRVDSKADYGEIPEIAKALAELNGTLVHGLHTAKETLQHFKRIVFLSPDLIEKDKVKIVDFVAQQVQRLSSLSLSSTDRDSSVHPISLDGLFNNESKSVS